MPEPLSKANLDVLQHVFRRLIDGELASLGAERHGLRVKREQAEFLAEVEAHRRDPIPF